MALLLLRRLPTFPGEQKKEEEEEESIFLRNQASVPTDLNLLLLPHPPRTSCGKSSPPRPRGEDPPFSGRPCPLKGFYGARVTARLTSLFLPAAVGPQVY